MSIVSSSTQTAARDLWALGAPALRDAIGPPSWQAWFAGAHAVDFDGTVLTLAVPAEIIKHRIEERFLADARGLLTRSAGHPVDIRVVVRIPERSAADLAPDPSAPLLAPSSEVPEFLPPPVDNPVDYSSAPLQIIPTNTFDTFIIGESNRFAHAAALAVAESPGMNYNPLFIYGGTGLGKTHLLHAIVNLIRRTSSLRASYTTSEQFTNEFIEAIRADRRAEFRERYRSTDILLIDDVQFFSAGAERTQEEFFHTFNSLYQANKQVVIASDRPPKAIAALEDRLRSRFQWGLTIDIKPPDLETRIAILRNKSERSNLSVPADVLEYIATAIQENIRELEGALNRVDAFAKLEGLPITREIAEDLLADIGSAGSRQVTSDLILRETSSYYDVTIEDLLGPSRRRPLVSSRQVCMYLHRELTDLSLPAIGDIFGNRDHTTILYAHRKISEMMAERRQLFTQVTDLTSKIKLG